MPPYELISVMKPTGGNPGAKGGINTHVIVIDKNDVASFPARDDKNTTIAGDIVLLAGKKMHIIEATAKTLDFKHTLVGEDDAKAWDITLDMERPGQEAAWEEFLNNNLGTDFYVIVRHCPSGAKKLAGGPCTPMKIDTAESGFREGNKTKLVFKATDSPFRAAIYSGSLDIEGDSGSGGAGL